MKIEDFIEQFKDKKPVEIKFVALGIGCDPKQKHNIDIDIDDDTLVFTVNIMNFVKEAFDTGKITAEGLAMGIDPIIVVPHKEQKNDY